MDKYLLDTNTFFELIACLAGTSVRQDEYDYTKIQEGKIYISQITEMEIISVIGKYRRGKPAQWQNCARIISEDGSQKCNRRYFDPGQSRWHPNRCRALLKLVKEMLEGNSPLLKVDVLELNEEIIHRAERFLMHSARYKFGSHDAIIAATAIVHSTEEEPLRVVTLDKGLRAAMREEGMEFVVPGKEEQAKEKIRTGSRE